MSSDLIAVAVGACMHAEIPSIQLDEHGSGRVQQNFRQMTNFRVVVDGDWWSGMGSLFNVSGKMCCNDTHVAIHFYRR